MSARKIIYTEKAPPPLPVYAQANVYGGMVYCSGQLGVDPVTKKFLEEGIGARTVSLLSSLFPFHIYKIRSFINEDFNMAAPLYNQQAKNPSSGL